MKQWPGAQRCALHKWANLKSHCPKHAHVELKRDYDRIIYANDGMVAREEYTSFLAKYVTERVGTELARLSKSPTESPHMDWCH